MNVSPVVKHYIYIWSYILSWCNFQLWKEGWFPELGSNGRRDELEAPTMFLPMSQDSKSKEIQYSMDLSNKNLKNAMQL